MSCQAPSSPVQNCPATRGPTHPWPWLLGHLAFPPPVPSHPRPSIFSGRRQIWQLIVHFLWQTYDYSHVNRFVHISSCFHGNTRLRMKNPKLQFANGLLTTCFPRGLEGTGWPGGRLCRLATATPQHPGHRTHPSYFVRKTVPWALSGPSHLIGD